MPEDAITRSRRMYGRACDGCDEPEGPIRNYEVLLPREGREDSPVWQAVSYCAACADNAVLSARAHETGVGFNGQSETLAIRRPASVVERLAAVLPPVDPTVPEWDEYLADPPVLSIEDDGNGGWIISHPALNGCALLLSQGEAVLIPPTPDEDLHVDLKAHIAGGLILDARVLP